MAVTRFLRAKKGAAALEFALITPVMLIAGIGLSELYFQFQAWQRISAATAQTADLIAQETQLTTASLDSMRLAAEVVLRPLPSQASTLNMDVASVGIDTAGGDARVLWRETRGPGLTIDMEAAKTLSEPGGSVIWVGLRYTYTAPITFVFPENREFTQYAFARPRMTRRIAINGKTERT